MQKLACFKKQAQLDTSKCALAFLPFFQHCEPWLNFLACAFCKIMTKFIYNFFNEVCETKLNEE
jgi:hypothetical protein